MKWLIILGLLGLFCAYIGVRYRRQIQTGIYVWKMFRKMRQAGNSTEKQIDKSKSTSEASLVKCAKCGKWISEKNALNLRSKTFYCSTKCMENAVKVG